MAFGGVYKALVVNVDADTVKVLVPQLFGEARVTLWSWIGPPPAMRSFGFISFIDGDSSYPVWLGTEKEPPVP